MPISLFALVSQNRNPVFQLDVTAQDVTGTVSFFFLFQRLYAVPPEEMTSRKRRLVAQTAPNLNLLRHILHAVDNKTMIEGRAREYRTRTKTIDDRFLFQFRSMNGPVQHKVTKREDKWSSRSQNGAREKFNIVCVATADGH